MKVQKQNLSDILLLLVDDFSECSSKNDALDDIFIDEKLTAPDGLTYAKEWLQILSEFSKSLYDLHVKLIL